MIFTAELSPTGGESLGRMKRRACLLWSTGLLLGGCVGEDDGQDPPAATDATDDRDGGTQDAEIVTPAATEVATGLAHPWGMACLPGGALLVTERMGSLQRVDVETGATEPIDGVPEIVAGGQGGLLDVCLHPAYPDEPSVYLTYVGADGDGASATHLGRGTYDPDAGVVEEFEELFVAEPFLDSDAHFGSRAIFDEDGWLYATVGDRQSKDFGPDHYAQDLGTALGSVVRLADDGSIPPDNPFVDDEGALDAIYSYGHRNPQAAAIRPVDGRLWIADHGEQDGDEIEVIQPGGNHGWPVAHYGCTYDSSEEIGDLPHERDDIVDPVHHWECASGGFPPSGMTFYDGDAFPDWQGDLFVGTLAGEYLGHFAVEDGTVTERPPLLEDRGWRVRDVTVDPVEGHLLVAIDDGEAPIVAIHPE